MSHCDACGYAGCRCSVSIVSVKYACVVPDCDEETTNPAKAGWLALEGLSHWVCDRHTPRDACIGVVPDWLRELEKRVEVLEAK